MCLFQENTKGTILRDWGMKRKVSGKEKERKTGEN
jgi:hypothetical protein